MDREIRLMLSRLEGELRHKACVRAQKKREKKEEWPGEIQKIGYTGRHRYEPYPICLWKVLKDHRRQQRAMGFSGRMRNLFRKPLPRVFIPRIESFFDWFTVSWKEH